MNNFTLLPRRYLLPQCLLSILTVILSQAIYSQEKTTIAPARVQHKQLDGINNSPSVPGDENWDNRLGFPITRWEQEGKAIAVIDSEIYLGGFIPVINDVARWNITHWSALSRENGNGYVDALAVIGDDLYVGGSFIVIDSVVVNRIARWNRLTQKWSVVKNDTVIGIDSHEGVYLSSGVVAMAVHGHDLYIGGSFTYAGGIVANNIVKWNSLFNSWSSLGDGIDGGVSAIAVCNGEIYVGGRFSSAGGVPANNIAKWNGRKWSALGSGVKGNVYAIGVFGKEVYVGGSFTEAGSVKANNIAKWNPAGNSWSSLKGNGTNNGTNSYVLAIASNKKFVYVGAGVDLADGQKAQGIAKWDPVNNLWSALGSGVYGKVKSIVTRSNDVFVAGTIEKVGGKDSKNFAIWHEPNAPPVISILPEMHFNEDKALFHRIRHWYPFVNDTDDADSTLRFTVLSGKQVKATRHPRGYSFSAPANWFGQDTLQLIVTDPYQLADTTSFVITVDPINDRPQLTSMPDSLSFKKGASIKLKMWDFAEDVETPDSLLLYRFSTSNPGLRWNFHRPTGTLVLTAPQFHGKAHLFVKAGDGKAAAYDTIAVRVELPNDLLAAMEEQNSQEQIPSNFVLQQNYPNPFRSEATSPALGGGNPTTQICYELPKAGHVSVIIYNALGQEVRRLVDRAQPVGYHHVTWNGRDQRGKAAPSGIYHYRLQAGDEVMATRKMLITK